MNNTNIDNTKGEHEIGAHEEYKGIQDRTWE